jgi:dipeptidyl aminopeptidase/acylaminoacyl peptidase
METHAMLRAIIKPTIVAALATVLAPPGASAQTPDYARADVIRTAARYVFGTSIRPRFLEDSVRFWYTSSAREDRGVTYVVDPVRPNRRPLFDNARLAAALSLEADTLIDPTKLPRFDIVDTGRTVELQLRKKIFRCGAATYACAPVDSIVWATDRALKNGPDWASRSPDDQWDVFLYNYNLYARPSATSDEEAIAKRDSVLAAQADTVAADSTQADSTQAETPERETPSDSVALPDGSIQLTTDGAEHWEWENDLFALWSGEEPKRWKPRRPRVTWAPDSRKLALERLDYRGLRRYPLYSSTKAQPVDKSYFYAVPGDTAYPQIDVYVVDVASAVLPATDENGDQGTAIDPVKVDQPPSPAINFSSGRRWSRTSDQLFTMSSSRGYKRMTLVSVDATTGATTEITRDSFPTWVESRGFRVANGGEDVFYVSERDGWAHIYRFGADGTFKNQVESGPYAVNAINRVDSIAHQIYFTASGRQGGVPYYGQLYRVDFDGSNLTLLTPEAGSHRAFFVPKANYFIDTYAMADEPPTIVLRSGTDGRVVMELARGDVEMLASLGWTPPELIQVKARDGTTDLWGLLYRPSDFDSTKSYPILDHIYPGPQVGSVRGWSFSARHEPRALAELGFIVLELDHMGTPGRSKAFHDFYFGNMGDNGIPDHIAAIRQLAARHRYIDINRVGIYGHSGGGFASTDAIFRYPDFFKVAVSGAGNHDNRTYGHFWGEKYQGLLETRGSSDNFEASANYTMAANLKGKLLLMHGDMDNNVHPANTLRVVDALIKANKDFDMIIFPDAAHGLPDYSIRKRWDYFVRHLLGVEPPKDYKMMDRPPFSFF